MLTFIVTGAEDAYVEKRKPNIIIKNLENHQHSRNVRIEGEESKQAPMKNSFKSKCKYFASTFYS